MNRNEIIAAINDLFDSNNDLKIRCEYYEMKEKKNLKVEGKEEKSEIDSTTLKLIECGKKMLLDKVLRDWYGVNVKRNVETKKLEIDSYEKWLEKSIDKSEIPNNMCLEEVEKVIYRMAIEIYEGKKIKAINKFEKEESQENEDE